MTLLLAGFCLGIATLWIFLELMALLLCERIDELLAMLEREESC
jgi:hypothetical protein